MKKQKNTRHLGCSVYLGLDNTGEENLQLLEQAYQLGYGRVFTSLHIPESDDTVFRKEVAEFFALAKDYHMDVISDISPNTFPFLGLKPMDLTGLHQMGVTTIRVDFGYSEKEISEMTKNPYGMKVQLNASTVTPDFFQRLDAYHPEYRVVDALHNFYPRTGTGISEACMIEKNNLLAERGILFSAFVPSTQGRRSPLKEGLPTLEIHRHWGMKEAGNHLFALGNQTVFVGDSFPSFAELQDLAKLRPGMVGLEICPHTKDPVLLDLLQQVHPTRRDWAEDAIRSSDSRLMGQGRTIAPNHTVERNYGDVTIDNQGYLRYAGELQILLKPQSADERVNVVASVLEKDFYLFPYLKNGMPFYFYTT